MKIGLDIFANVLKISVSAVERTTDRLWKSIDVFLMNMISQICMESLHILEETRDRK